MEDSSFLLALREWKPRVWASVKRFLPSDQTSDFHRLVNDYPERQGKYVRPGLLLLSCQAHGGDPERALTLAAAMQLSEEWLLVHDDMEDGSEERRSTPESYRPTLNAVYGDALAVNAGDALHVCMWRALGQAVREMGPEAGWRAYDLLDQTLMATIQGQHAELSWIRDRRLDLTDQDYYDMADRKAGLYTIVTPLQLGAIAAGITDQASLQSLAQWGVPMGRAFQIWDDAMNLTTDPTAQGKERAGDVWEGKRTLSLLHLMRHATPLERAWVAAVYAKNRSEKSFEEIQRIVKLMERYGSIEAAREAAKAFTQEALTAFNSNTEAYREPAKQALREAINFVANRQR